MAPVVALQGFYDYRLIALSTFVAVLAAYAALDLAGRVASARGGIRLAWLCSSAAVMGTGISASHYIGTASFKLPIPVLFDLPTVLLSLFAAILVSGFAFLTVARSAPTRRRMIVGGIIMGCGIASIHYIGMEAMRFRALCVYAPGLVLLSILIPMVIAYAALQQAFYLREARITAGWRRLSSALLLGVAIPITHFIGMAATHFVLRSSVTDHDSVSIASVGIGVIAMATLLLLGLVFLSSRADHGFALQKQEAVENLGHLQVVFDSMADAVLIMDSNRNIVQHNRAALKLLGIEGKLVTLQEITDTFEGYSPNGTLMALDDWPIKLAMDGIYSQNVEVTIRGKATGATVTTEISTAPIATLSDGSAQSIVILRDITRRKLLDETRSRLAAIVESSEDAIIGKDENGIVTSWNSGAQKVFGYTAAEMVGQPIQILLPDDRLQEENDILARIKQGEIVDHIETVRKKKNGQFIHVSLTISPIRDARGKVVGASKIARNITDRKHLEKQLHQSQKMEAIGQLTGGIAHDFNNLLGVIVGNLDLLERLIAGNELALKRVETAQRAAARGADLTRRLLAFSSSVELRPAPTKLHHCIHNMIELARALGPEVTITTHFDDSIPLVLVDPAGLETALLNLVVNARDAMPSGGTLTISTQLSTLEENYPPVLAGELKAGPYACVSVSDTGHGMSKETLGRVFEPFFTTKERGKGTGLGLAMVYGFAKQSGGTVRIYSEPGYGTTVTFYLLLAEDFPAPAPVAAPTLPAARLTGKVLVVDDERDLLVIAAAYLERMGYKAYCATDGPSALRLLELHKDIDLIVTDIIMPGGMNGADLVRKVRDLLPQIRVVYSSGFPADALAERSMPVVDALLLRKPYQRADFETAIRMALE